MNRNGMTHKVGDIVFFQTGTPGDPQFPLKLFTNEGQGFEITKVGKEESHLTAIGETTKPPRKYKIDNFRLVKPETIHQVILPPITITGK